MVDIKILYAGLCGSDIAKINTNSNVDIRKMGHEIVGSDISDRKSCYVVNPFICSNECNSKDNCDMDSFLFCSDCLSLGKQLQGGFCNQLIVPNDNLWEFDVDDRYRCVGTLVDGIAVIFHALHQIDIAVANDILVLGDGVIGCLATYVIKKLYPKVDIKFYVRNEKKRVLLNNIFYNEIIDNFDKSKEKYDFVFECVGGRQSETINYAIDMVKQNGSIVVLGAFSEKIETPINYRQLFYKQIILKGINSYCKKNNDFSMAIDFAKQYCEELYMFITKKILLDDIEKYVYYDIKKDKKRIKTVFVNE